MMSDMTQMTSDDVVCTEGDWKLINFKVKSTVVSSCNLSNFKRNINSFHLEPYYKGKIKFQNLCDMNLIYQLLTMSTRNEKETPDINKIYSMIVPLSWDYKRVDELFLHSLVTFYYLGEENQIRYKVEIRPTSRLLKPSEVDYKRMAQAVHYVYKGDLNVVKAYQKLVAKQMKVTSLYK